MIRTTIFATLICAAARTVCAQNESPSQAVNDMLAKSDIASMNLWLAVTEHMQKSPQFSIAKQQPEDDQPSPTLRRNKDGMYEYYWGTPSQHARYIMEDFRQAGFALKSASRLNRQDVIALTVTLKYWPKLRDIACHDSPEIPYYDLAGKQRSCSPAPKKLLSH
jgi:hypothetical protein